VTSNPARRRRRDIHVYNWVSDFPLRLQETESKKNSNITLEFALSPPEIDEFRTEIGSRLNGTLPIAFSFRRNDYGISIAKPGRGHKILNAKALKITEFVARKIEIQYIPAVRTADAAQRIVEELVAYELSKIEGDPRYIQALADIEALQEPVLEALSESIAGTMRNFLPQIVNVKLSIGSQDRSFALRGITQIYIDDGVETLLEYKGDGAQSLAAVAIMRHASQTSHQNKEVIVALEELESHLHPSAIRELRGVLRDLAERHQVVLSTHNPLFTNRDHVESNVIVLKSKAYSAKSVKDVRSVLGVRVEDNLSSAEVILLVEGEEDRIALLGILSAHNQTVKRELQSGRLSIDVLAGATNLTYRARLHSESLCQIHAFLDDDSAGRRSFEKAAADGVLVLADVNLSKCGGKTEAELEDLYAEEVYEDVLRNEIGLELPRRGPDKNKKWTERVRNLLRAAGKPYDDGAVRPIKFKVARVAQERGWAALHPSKVGPLESLANSLERKLSST
jgi:putative ATP-dependent endonuclease of OLD family